MRRKFFVLSVAALLAAFGTMAQSPAPIIVPAATDSTPAPENAQKDADDAVITAAIALLQELKAQNEQTIKKQQATLEALDQLQKDADQIRIFSKRG
ncbi:MAG: hypothetical protein DME86_12015 [Verrucomicrobia bacterium]|jgi:phage/plasmid-associated DNA primase|nr:MAG: hypothetical protein DME86_12015 [Verrucomicrobiota bacterium]